MTELWKCRTKTRFEFSVHQRTDCVLWEVKRTPSLVVEAFGDPSSAYAYCNLRNTGLDDWTSMVLTRGDGHSNINPPHEATAEKRKLSGEFG